VASDVGGHRELIRHEETGVLVPAGSSAALAEEIGRLLDDPARRLRLASQGAAWVRSHRTWDRMIEPYGRIYGRLLPGAARAGVAVA
jgi:glycosyltransferase involved in cell wall biosynthesis